MTEPWRPFFDVYKAERPGVKHNGWNPERVFEAGFNAGMLNRAAVAIVPEIVPLILADFGDGWSLWNSPRDAGDRRPFVLSNPDWRRGGARFKNRAKAESFYRRRIVGEAQHD